MAKAAASQQALKLAFASTPWGAVLVGLTAITVAVYKFATRTTEARKSMKDFQKQFDAESFSANRLFEALKKTNEGTEERRIIIKKLI